MQHPRWAKTVPSCPFTGMTGCIPEGRRPPSPLTDAFKDRVLGETPKFLRERLAKVQAAVESSGSCIGTSDPSPA